MTKPIPRIRKQKARRRAQDAAAVVPTNATADSNAEEIIPTSVADRERRKQKLRDELKEQKQSEQRLSGKKKKRLDKYIDTKIRKEESLELIKKLAAHKVDTSLFKSSRKLGRGDESKRERLGRILQEKRAGISALDEEAALWQERRQEDGNSLLPENHAHPEPAQAQRPVQFVEPVDKSSEFGSGLKRALEFDGSGNPLIPKRKRSKHAAPRSRIIPVSNDREAPESPGWEGFDTESEDGGIDLRGASTDYHLSAYDNWERLSESNSSRSSIHTASESTISEENETSGNENSEDDPETSKTVQQERLLAFKAWASEQRNEAVDFTPSMNIDLLKEPKTMSALNSKPNLELTYQESSKSGGYSVNNELSPSSVEVAGSAIYLQPQRREVFNVPVERTSQIEETRLALPVVAEEQKIMEAIHSHDTVILWGATGSGKTTQVPQFLYEAGYGAGGGPNPGLIGVTQPRRVAAVSMAKRVATEMGNHGSRVSYQIRFDSTIGKNTAIKFMTDGVLVREISQDFTLSKYSAVVIDEAHERSVNTDILIGMLSRIVETRANLASKTKKYRPLKLIIMSATLRTADLTQNTNLFRKVTPPVIQAEGRQYPVTVHFARRTEREYLEEAFQKVSRGHKKLPQGAILVFLTGQNEINLLSKRLKRELPSTETAGHGEWKVRTSAAEEAIENEDVDLSRLNLSRKDYESDSDAEIRGLDNDDNDDEFSNTTDPEEPLKVHVLPLYSQLPVDQQMRIFENPPEGSRMIVLATNVAETSLTIPNIRYVFDCGRAKEKYYDKASGVQSFDIGWISKASASQRAGRAGRTGPGHCYRLYSSAVFERDFPDFEEPEISKTPLEGVVLQLKSLGIPNVATFPFPTAPDKSSLIKAEQLLEYLGAIVHGKVTRLGKDLALYPLSPRLSKILCIAQNYEIAEQAVALVAVLAMVDLFVPESQLEIKTSKPTGEDDPWTEADNQEALRREASRKAYANFHGHLARFDRNSDALKLLTTLNDFLQLPKGSSRSTSRDLFDTYTRVKALQEASKLRHQLATIISTYNPSPTATISSSETRVPTPRQAKLINQVVAAGYIDQIAIRADLSPSPPPHFRKPKRATDVPYTTLFPSWTVEDAHRLAAEPPDTAKAKTDAEVRLRSVYIHPSSVLAHSSPESLPQYLVYSHISRASSRTAATETWVPKTRIHPLTPISATQIVALASGTPLLEDSKPVGRIEMLERDDAGRERRRVTCVPFLKAGRDSGGGNGWPIPPARRIVQRRELEVGWIAETNAEN